MKHIHTSNFSIRKKLLFYSYLIITPILVCISIVLFVHNYQQRTLTDREQWQKNVENLSGGIDNLLGGVIEFGTYICINNDITQLLLEEDAETVNLDSQVWIHRAPMATLQDMIALSGQIKTLAIYPENGVQPYLRCTDASSYIKDLKSVQNTKIYEQVNEQKGSPVFRVVSKNGGDTYLGNRTDKIVMYREIYDRAKKNKLGYLVIGASTEKYIQLCSNSLSSQDAGIIVRSKDGSELFTAGIVPEELREKLKAGEPSVSEGYQIFSTKSRETGIEVYEVIPMTSIRSNLFEIGMGPAALLIGFLTGLYPVLVLISNIITKPLKKLCIAMEKFKSGDFSQKVEVTTEDELGEVSACFNQMVDDMKLLIENNYVMALREKESELNALQAQINPHFLYNTLDTLYWQATNDGNDKIAEDILALSNLFRLVLGQGKGIVSIEIEKRLIEEYLHIQKMRFSEELNYEIKVDEELLNVQIPKLILQPFVENAVVHGFERTGETCMIRIIGKKEHDKICFLIEDNGIGMNAEQLSAIWEEQEEQAYRGQRIGRYAIRNVKERLNLLYHGDFCLEITSKEGVGTRVRIEIPVT